MNEPLHFYVQPLRYWRRTACCHQHRPTTTDMHRQPLAGRSVTNLPQPHSAWATPWFAVSSSNDRYLICMENRLINWMLTGYLIRTECWRARLSTWALLSSTLQWLLTRKRSSIPPFEDYSKILSTQLIIRSPMNFGTFYSSNTQSNVLYKDYKDSNYHYKLSFSND